MFTAVDVTTYASDVPDAARISSRLDKFPLDHLASIGNLGHLEHPLLALFCSSRCPGKLILDAYDVARALRQAGVAVVGGFHTPVEKDCLDLLLRGKQPVVICPARNIERMRIPRAWKTPLESGRLLVLSPFKKQHRRMTAELAAQRNRFVAALADEILVVHAAAGSKTAENCCEWMGWDRRVFVFDHKDNQLMMERGARGFDLAEFLSRRNTSSGSAPSATR